MRAAVVNEAKHFDVVEVPDPTPNPGELVLAVHACGICGSDLKAVANMPAGLVMGHEFCGSVVARGVGVDATAWPDGTRVSALPLIGCGRCAACVTGDVAHCPTIDMVGVGGSSGAYAQFVRVAAGEAFVLPDGVPFDHGALVEPVAVGLHAVTRAALTPHDRVLVVGGGPVGLAVAMWARSSGARRVTVSDPVAARRDLALAIGATDVVSPDAVEGTFDVVFECVGTPGMIATAAAAAGVHGRVVVAGVCTKPDTFVPVLALMKELTVHFVVYYRRQDYATTIDLLAQDRLPIAPFVTGRTDLAGFDAAFTALKSPTDQCKVLVLPN